MTITLDLPDPLSTRAIPDQATYGDYKEVPAGGTVVLICHGCGAYGYAQIPEEQLRAKVAPVRAVAVECCLESLEMICTCVDRGADMRPVLDAMREQREQPEWVRDAMRRRAKSQPEEPEP